MLGGVKRASATGAALIILLTFIAYIPAIRGGFLWDDDTLIIENPLIKATDGLYRIWFTTEPADYYPVTNSLAWLQWHLWGHIPAGYHVVNVLLHAINAVLAWMVLSRLKIPGAWVAGLVFALHPVNVATAAWISEQKNTLSMFFYLVAILLFLRFNEGHGWSWYGLSLAAFLLALLSKTAVVMLPGVLLGCVWWTRGRLRWREILYSVPFCILSVSLGLLTIQFQDRHRFALGLPASSVTFASHLAVAGSVPWFYLCKAVLPVHLTVIYPEWQIADSQWTSYMLGVILVGVLTLSWWKRNKWGRPVLFALGYFVTMLFPVLGFWDQTFYRYASVADHWQYYSIIAPIALAVAFAQRLGHRLGERQRSRGTAAGVAVLLALAVATWTRAGIYASNATLWRDNVEKRPDAYVAHHNLGFALTQAGKLEEAIGQFRKTLRLKPDFARAHFNLGSALAQTGRTQEAIEQLRCAVRIDPNDFEAHNNLANALIIANQLPDAVKHYEQTLRLKPDLPDVHFNLGLAYEQKGDVEKAIEQYELALRLAPAMTEAQRKLAHLRPAP